jgi:serine protease Do
MVPAGLGSGTIIHPEGCVITNRHVVTLPNNQTAETVFVKLNDRREFRAKVLGVDPKTDIAVLKVDERSACLTPASPTATRCASATWCWPSATRSASA